MKNLPTQSLDFQEIKDNFISFLKGSKVYKDFNFDASGINTLLNILAYNTHMIGYYVKMLLDESYVDSARTKEALLSHGKVTGYLSKGKRSAKGEVQLKVTIQENEDPISQVLLIPKGSMFASHNAVNDRRHFVTTEDTIISNREESGSDIIYLSDPFIIHEGTLEKWRFLVNTSIYNQRFIIPDAKIDIDTIRVFVSPHEGSNESIEYRLVDDLFALDNNSNVFFITTNEEGNYQVFFGNNIFGNQPDHNNVITVEYVSTNGLSGNGAKTFTYDPPQPDFLPDYYIGNFSNFEIITNSPSSGGMEPENIEDLRFSIPNHFRRQNRIVTESDYYSILMSQYRNIESMNVWGGETHHKREYGKTFVSIKPRYAEKLTSSSKEEIRKTIIQKYGVVGTDVLFLDPEYIDIHVQVKGKVDGSKTIRTLNDIRSSIIERMNEYDTTILNKFENAFVEVNFLEFLKNEEDVFKLLFNIKTLSKRFRHIHRNTSINTLTLGNPILPGIKSSLFNYAGRQCYLKDDIDSQSVGNEFSKEIINPILKSNLLIQSFDSFQQNYILNLQKTNIFMYDSKTDEKFIQSIQGSVDYENGNINFQLPETATLPGFENSSSGYLKWHVTPMFPDIITSENNILRIASKKVYLT